MEVKQENMAMYTGRWSSGVVESCMLVEVRLAALQKKAPITLYSRVGQMLLGVENR